jgi:Dyp-type peroxidase family
MIFARDDVDLDARTREIRGAMQEFGGLAELSTQDGVRIPGRREHFGYREGISEVIVEGSGREALPGWGPPSKPGEFIMGYPDEYGTIPAFPQPALLGRNGCYLVYRKLYQDVAGFRRFLRQHARDEDEVEWLAAKLMGRWRSGAPLVLAPERDDPALADDPQRSSDFDYARMDPQGLACPLGAHVRRANPRDSVHGANRNRLIRRGLPYGPPLPEGAPDDGIDRGVAVIMGCGSISRQFEFVQRAWLNNRKFNGLENDKDPICGDNDGSSMMTIQRKPLRRRIHGIPRFVTVKGGGYFFAPGIAALRHLAIDEPSSLDAHS